MPPGNSPHHVRVPGGSGRAAPGPWPGVVAGHSFMSTKPAALTPLVRLARLDHNPESAEDSWRRIFAFFGEHLRSGPAPSA
jgi:dienelactone hydrolase